MLSAAKNLQYDVQNKYRFFASLRMTSWREAFSPVCWKEHTQIYRSKCHIFLGTWESLDQSLKIYFAEITADPLGVAKFI